MIVVSLQDPSGQPSLAVIVKKTYRIHRGRCVPESGAPPIVEDPRHVESTNRSALDRLAEDTDLISPLKPSTDVLLSGSAHSKRGPVRMLDTGVSVGPLRKQIRVWGQRTVHLDQAGRLRFTEPEPFTVASLAWDHAYGGRDDYAEALPAPGARRSFDRSYREERGAFAYPRNSAGRGFFVDVDRERLQGTLAPHLEDAEDPVLPGRLLARDPLDWLDRPAAASYEPVGWTSFPRVLWWLGADAGSPSRPVHEVRRGAILAQDMAARGIGSPPDPRAYNCAATGLSGARLRGDERVKLWNLHPEQELAEIDLPGETPRLLLEPPGCGAAELAASLQTVLLRPDEERVTLTWTGALPVAASFPDEMCNTMRRAVQWVR